MIDCCRSGCKERLSIQKFSGIAKTVRDKRIPYSVDNRYVMICSPVGNQNKFSIRRADIALSGYSTAPEAAITYIQDADTSGDRECRNSFNTGRMKKGIKTILTCLGFIDAGNLLDSALSTELNQDFNMMLTQMLCMISDNGSAKANHVETILKRSVIIREQAEYSVTAWYERIRSSLKENGLILLMGKNAKNLIRRTYYTGENRFRIDYSKRLSGTTMLDEIEKQFRLYSIIHASGIAYRQNKERWLKEEDTKEINRILLNEYPRHVQVVPNNEYRTT